MRRVLILCSTGIIFLALHIGIGPSILSLIVAIAAAGGFITLAHKAGWLKNEDRQSLFGRDEQDD